MPQALREWVELLPPLIPKASSEDGVAQAPGHAKASVVVHRGCVAQVLADSANRNAAKLLTRCGYQVVELGRTVCCGALDLHSGNRERALQFARANVRAIRDSGADFVISTASGCSTAMAEYGELLKDDPELAQTAREISGQGRRAKCVDTGRANSDFRRP